MKYEITNYDEQGIGDKCSDLHVKIIEIESILIFLSKVGRRKRDDQERNFSKQSSTETNYRERIILTPTSDIHRDKKEKKKRYPGT